VSVSVPVAVGVLVFGLAARFQVYLSAETAGDQKG